MRFSVLASSAFLGVLILAQPALAQEAATRSTIRGFRLVQEGTGVQIYKRGKDFLHVVTPALGGRIEFLHGNVVPSELHSTVFTRKDIQDWWKDWKAEEEGAFSMVNGQFFDMRDENKAPLAFSMKVNGTVYTGYGDSAEYPGDKRVFVVGETRNRVVSYTDDAGQLVRLPEKNAIVGLAPDIPKSASKRVGRTFMAVARNGRTLLFHSPTATQRYATRILRSLGANNAQIVMLDGGGSSQLVHKGTLLLPQSKSEAQQLRRIPQALGITD